MRRTVEIVLVFLGAIAVGAWLWKPEEPILEPLAAIFGGTSLLSLIDLLWPRPTDADRDEKRANRNREYRTALARIEHEWNHLEGLNRNPAQYAGKAYAEEDALELVGQDITPLAKYWGLRRTVGKALAEIKRNADLPSGKKDVRSLVRLLTTIRTKLSTYLK
jgi:hypothetical protein